MKRERADVLLVQRGLFPSRERARAAILAGDVLAAGEPLTKAGRQLPVDVDLSLKKKPEYVSRGAVKLARALDVFNVHPAAKVCVDVGASTGGFTELLLERGAAKVYAIDVGYGQLAWKLRNDPRVVVMERTNVRHLNAESLPESPTLETVDVSFISIKKILPSIAGMLAGGGELLALVKPQFEGERADVGRGGIVREASAHRRILCSLLDPLASSGLALRGFTYSPIKGADGNIEYWLYAVKTTTGKRAGHPDELIDSVVEEAHSFFSR